MPGNRCYLKTSSAASSGERRFANDWSNNHKSSAPSNTRSQLTYELFLLKSVEILEKTDVAKGGCERNIESEIKEPSSVRENRGRKVRKLLREASAEKHGSLGKSLHCGYKLRA